jgi:hypothetical protein
MTATDERTGTPRITGSSDSPRGRSRLRRRHEDAVIQAEVRRLARALAPYRVLQKDALRRTAGADSWHDGGFDRALSAAVEAGKIKRLAEGFYACGEDDASPASGGRAAH